MKRVRSLFPVAFVLMAALACVTALITPAVAPAIKTMVTGTSSGLPETPYMSGNPIDCAMSLMAYNEVIFSKGFWYIPAATAACLLVGAALIMMQQLRNNPNRAVKGGVLGDSEIISSSKRLRKMNAWWNGEDEPAEFGFVVGATPNGYYLDTATPMGAVFGATGAGKTQLTDIENMHVMYARGCNGVITGKDELLELTGEKAWEIYDRVLVISVSGYPNATRYNPMAEVVRLYDAGDIGAMKREARFVAKALIPSSGAPDASFFEDSARDILAALIIVVATSDARPEQKNMQSVAELFFKGRTGKGDDPAAPLKDYFRSLGDHPCASFANDFLADGGKSKGALNVNTTVKNALQMFTDEAVAEVTCESDFSMREVHESRTVTYIMMPEKGDPYLPILECWLDSWWRTSKQVKAEHGGVLPHQTVLLGDEWGNQNRVDFYPEYVTTARSANMKGLVLYQNIGQLDIYNTPSTGNAGRNTILGSTGLKIILNLNDPDTCRVATEWVGKRTVKTKGMSEQRNMAGGSVGVSYNEHGEDLIHTWEWQHRVPDRDGAIVVKSGANGNAGAEGVMNTPLTYASKTPAGKYFGLGDKAHDREKCEAFRKLMMQAQGTRPAPAEPWCPDFNLPKYSCDVDDCIDDDDAAAWD